MLTPNEEQPQEQVQIPAQAQPKPLTLSDILDKHSETANMSPQERYNLLKEAIGNAKEGLEEKKLYNLHTGVKAGYGLAKDTFVEDLQKRGFAPKDRTKEDIKNALRSSSYERNTTGIQIPEEYKDFFSEIEKGELKESIGNLVDVVTDWDVIKGGFKKFLGDMSGLLAEAVDPNNIEQYHPRMMTELDTPEERARQKVAAYELAQELRGYQKDTGEYWNKVAWRDPAIAQYAASVAIDVPFSILCGTVSGAGVLSRAAAFGIEKAGMTAARVAVANFGSSMVGGRVVYHGIEAFSHTVDSIQDLSEGAKGGLKLLGLLGIGFGSASTLERLLAIKWGGARAKALEEIGAKGTKLANELKKNPNFEEVIQNSDLTPETKELILQNMKYGGKTNPASTGMAVEEGKVPVQDLEESRNLSGLDPDNDMGRIDQWLDDEELFMSHDELLAQGKRESAKPVAKPEEAQAPSSAASKVEETQAPRGETEVEDIPVSAYEDDLRPVEEDGFINQSDWQPLVDKPKTDPYKDLKTPQNEAFYDDVYASTGDWEDVVTSVREAQDIESRAPSIVQNLDATDDVVKEAKGAAEGVGELPEGAKALEAPQRPEGATRRAQEVSPEPEVSLSFKKSPNENDYKRLGNIRKDIAKAEARQKEILDKLKDKKLSEGEKAGLRSEFYKIKEALEGSPDKPGLLQRLDKWHKDYEDFFRAHPEARPTADGKMPDGIGALFEKGLWDKRKGLVASVTKINQKINKLLGSFTGEARGLIARFRNKTGNLNLSFEDQVKAIKRLDALKKARNSLLRKAKGEVVQEVDFNNIVPDQISRVDLRYAQENLHAFNKMAVQEIIDIDNALIRLGKMEKTDLTTATKTILDRQRQGLVNKIAFANGKDEIIQVLKDKLKEIPEVSPSVNGQKGERNKLDKLIKELQDYKGERMPTNKPAGPGIDFTAKVLDEEWEALGLVPRHRVEQISKCIADYIERGVKLTPAEREGITAFVLQQYKATPKVDFPFSPTAEPFRYVRSANGSVMMAVAKGFIEQKYPEFYKYLQILEGRNAARDLISPDTIIFAAQDLTRRAGPLCSTAEFQNIRPLLKQSFELLDEVMGGAGVGQKARDFTGRAIDVERASLHTALQQMVDKKLGKVSPEARDLLAQHIQDVFPTMRLAFFYDKALPNGMGTFMDGVTSLISVGEKSKLGLDTLTHEMGHYFWYYHLNASQKMEWLEGMRTNAGNMADWMMTFPNYVDRLKAVNQIKDPGKLGVEMSWLTHPAEMFAEQFSAFMLGNKMPSEVSAKAFSEIQKSYKTLIDGARLTFEKMPYETKAFFLRVQAQPRLETAVFAKPEDILKQIEKSPLFLEESQALERINKIDAYLEGKYTPLVKASEMQPESVTKGLDLDNEARAGEVLTNNAPFWALAKEQRAAMYEFSDLSLAAESQIYKALYGSGDLEEAHLLLKRMGEEIGTPHDVSKRLEAVLGPDAKTIDFVDTENMLDLEFMLRQYDGPIDQIVSRLAQQTDDKRLKAMLDIASQRIMYGDLLDLGHLVGAKKGRYTLVDDAFFERLSEAERFAQAASNGFQGLSMSGLFGHAVRLGFVGYQGLDHNPDGTMTFRWKDAAKFSFLLPGMPTLIKKAYSQGLPKVLKGAQEAAKKKFPNQKERIDKIFRTSKGWLQENRGFSEDLSQMLSQSKAAQRRFARDTDALADSLFMSFSANELTMLAFMQTPTAQGKRYKALIEARAQKGSVQSQRLTDADRAIQTILAIARNEMTATGLGTKEVDDLLKTLPFFKTPKNRRLFAYEIDTVPALSFNGFGKGSADLHKEIEKNFPLPSFVSRKYFPGLYNGLKRRANAEGIILTDDTKVNLWFDNKLMGHRVTVAGSADNAQVWDEYNSWLNQNPKLRAAKAPFEPVRTWEGVEPLKENLLGEGFRLKELKLNSFKATRNLDFKELANSSYMLDAALNLKMLGRKLSREIGVGHLLKDLSRSSYAIPTYKSIGSVRARLGKNGKEVYWPYGIAVKRAIQQGWQRLPEKELSKLGLSKYGLMSDGYLHPEAVRAVVENNPSLLEQTLSMVRNNMVHDSIAEVAHLYMNTLSIWKGFKTILNPATHVNNFVSNALMGFMLGHNPLEELNWGRKFYKLYDQHLQVRKYQRDLDFKKAQDLTLKMNMDPLYVRFREILESRMCESTMWQSELKLEEMIDLRNGWSDPSPSLIKKGWNWAGKMYEKEDLLYKFGAFHLAKEQGKSTEEALKYAYEAYFDYSQVNKVTGFLRATGAIPFVTYTAKVAPAIVKASVRNPERVAGLALSLFLANELMFPEWYSSLSKEDREAAMPEWTRNSFFGLFPSQLALGEGQRPGALRNMNISSKTPGGGMFQSGGDDSAGSFSSVSGALKYFFLQNPLLSTIMNGIVGKNVAMDRPYGPRANTPESRQLSFFEYVKDCIGQWGPSNILNPYSGAFQAIVRWAVANDYLDQKPSSLSPLSAKGINSAGLAPPGWTAAFSQAGLTVTDIDPLHNVGVQIRQEKASTQEYINELKRQMANLSPEERAPYVQLIIDAQTKSAERQKKLGDLFTRIKVAQDKQYGKGNQSKTLPR